MTEQYVSSPFTIFKGNDLSPEFRYKLDGVYPDISAAELTFVLTVSEYDNTELFRLENTAAGGDDDEISWVDDGTDAKFYVHIVSANTASLDEGTYWWEIEMILDGKKTTIGQNKLEILETMIST